MWLNPVGEGLFVLLVARSSCEGKTSLWDRQFVQDCFFIRDYSVELSLCLT